jgi:hypothetical protein
VLFRRVNRVVRGAVDDYVRRHTGDDVVDRGLVRNVEIGPRARNDVVRVGEPAGDGRSQMTGGARDEHLHEAP